MATTDRVTRLEQAVQRWRTWQQSHDKWHEEFAKEMEEEFERSAKRRQAMIQKCGNSKPRSQVDSIIRTAVRLK